MFWIGQDGQVWSQWWDQAPGDSWDQHPPFAIAAGFPVLARADSPVSCVARTAQHLDVFWIGQDGQVWSQWWDQAPGDSWDQHPPFAIAAGFPVLARADSPVSCVARTAQHLDVFWIGQDGQVWSQWWDQAPGDSWDQHPPFPIAAGFPVLARSW